MGDPANPNSRAEALYQALRDAIASGELPPGGRLPSERALAQEQQLAREQVREAFSRLEGAGLVLGGPGRVRRVRNLLESHLQLPLEGVGDDRGLQLQMMEVRALLEGECAWHAARRASAAQLRALAEEYARLHEPQGETTLARARADLRFHMRIAQSSQNLLLISFSQLFYARYFNAIHGVLSRTLKKQGRYPDGIRAQHAGIHQAVQARDAEAARRCAREHILSTAALLK